VDAISLGVALAGLVFGLSLIVAIGPQNTYVLRQGLRREYVLLVVGVCAVSDVAMIAVGTGGAGAVLTDRAWLVRLVGLAGATFLLGYAALAARRALRPAATSDGRSPGPRSAATALAACLAFTWLNPGVYVDTVLVLGPVSHSHGGHAWWFAAGAMLASVLWFGALGFGARIVGPLFERPRAWRVLDAAVAVVMTLTAVRLLATL
jgi:L-lysine exporter family protein LysE/ArgO